MDDTYQRDTPAIFMMMAGELSSMPATLEVKCTDGSCTLDMFELHYTYDMPDDVGVTDFTCPYCGETETLEAIEL